MSNKEFYRVSKVGGDLPYCLTKSSIPATNKNDIAIIFKPRVKITREQAQAICDLLNNWSDNEH